MSAATTTSRPAPSRGPITELFTGGGSVRRAAWIFVGLMLLVSIVRIISGEPSSGPEPGRPPLGPPARSASS